MTFVPSMFRLVMAATASAFVTVASAATYKCEVDGTTVYGDRPCVAGKQSELSITASEPTAADRAAAAARQRSDKVAADALARDRLQQERLDRMEARRVSERADRERGMRTRICTKLALRARRAREDYSVAGPAERPKRQIVMQRAEEDHEAGCRKR